jgi:hypothetical protein
MFKIVNISLAYYYIPLVLYIIFPYIVIRALKVKKYSLDYGLLNYSVLLFPILLILSILLLKYSIYFSLYLVFFYFGGYLFYVFFRQTAININIQKILILIAVLTIAEAIAINTIILPSDLPNWPLTAEMTKIHGSTSRGSVTLGGFNYLRPMGFGGNSSISAVLILSMLAFVSKNNKCKLWVKIISILSVICLYSGNGFILLSLYIILFSRFKLLPVILFTLLVSFSDFQKLDFFYYQAIFLDISENFLNVISEIEPYELLSGSYFSTELAIGGDFYWLYFFQWFGVVGIFFYMVAIIFNTNKINWIPLFFLLISTFHYHVIFSIPGQMLFGYFLSRKNPLLLKKNIQVK